MLKVRVIPTLLRKGFGLVKGVGFQSWRRVGPVLPAVKVYNRREVDELMLFDIMASENQEKTDLETIQDVSRDCFVPLTVGGGITHMDDVQQLLRAGADKISLNTANFDRPELATQVAKRFGEQCIVASIDAKADGDGWLCYSHSGSQNTSRKVVEFAREMEDRGAGEILITSIERDGTMTGYDLALIEAVVRVVTVPVIASGGAGNYQHFVEAITQSGASAVAAASMFHFTEQTPAGAKARLAEAGLPVRTTYLGS